jgi:exodeoxyribonuclease V beta subunit
MNPVAFDVLHTPLETGTVLLEASAGTGKTYTLVGIVLRLLLERRIERLDQALVVTFTVAATDELKNRLRQALQDTLRAIHTPTRDPLLGELARRPGAEGLLRQALATFDEVGITTIHGFCKRVLEDAAFESRQAFVLEFTPDPLPLLQLAAADAIRGQYRAGATLRGPLLRRGKHTPESLVETYRLWRRHPDVRLSPFPADFERHLALAEAALPAIVRALDDRAMADIESIVWKMDKTPPAVASPASREQFRARLHREPEILLQTLLALAPSSYRDLVNRTETPQSVYDHPFFAACEVLWRACDDAALHLRSALLQAMHERVEREKERAHVLTYDDLLLRTAAALQDPARRPFLLQSLRSRYEVGLIDEFQDTDSLQYRIFADLFAGKTLFLVGDPKQAIYSFRGADLRTYLGAQREAAHRHTLLVNHRSSASMVEAVNRLFAGHAAPFVDARIQALPIAAAAGHGERTIVGDGDAVLRWRFLPFARPGKFPNKADAEALVAADVAAEVSRLLRRGARLDDRTLRPRDLAILTRTNAQAISVQTALRAVGVASAIGKAGDIFLTDELGELQRFLHAVLQPSDLRRVRAAMATRLWGFDAAGLAALEADDDAFDRHLDDLARWRRLWLQYGFIVMQEQVLVDLDVNARFLAWQGGERRLTNFRQLFEMLHAAEHAHRLSPEGLLAWLQHERANQEDLDYTVRELRLESDDDAAQILTVHGSKGLQYEVVFCPFLWDAKGPRSPDLLTTGEGHEIAFGLAKEQPSWSHILRERFEEELRLCYVALTRAKRRCYVHWGAAAKATAQSALTWLLLGRAEDVGADKDPAKPSWVLGWSDRMEDATAEWRKRLAAIVAASAGTMDLLDVPPSPAATRVPAEQPPPLREPRRARREPAARALHSFSSLIANAPDPEPTPDRRDAAVEPLAPPVPARGIFAFARGPAAGQCLHTVLEQIDLAAAASPATTAVVRETLAAAGLAAADAHSGEIDPTADVQRALVDLAAALAHANGPPLAALCGGKKQVEWQFALPAEHADVQELARILEQAPAEHARAQGRRLRTLRMAPLRGFLVGFVDLVAEHDGRYWVLDWKSNHLGNDAADYAAPHLAPVMVDHDYVLQYHLYVLALHRHLRARLPGYDYERHMGGVVYAFLRGALPGTACGMFHARVPFPVVDALDRWAAGGRGGAEGAR